MMCENMKKQIEEAIKKYSFEGDNSLECIGFVAEENQLLSCKVYRMYRNNASVETLSLPFVVRQHVAQVENRSPNLRFFDYSLRKDEKGSPIYSISFLVKGRYNKSDYIQDRNDIRHQKICEVIESVFHTKITPLIQIGVLIDDCGKVLQRKYYYTLNQNDKRCTMETKKVYFLEHKKNIEEFICGLFEDFYFEDVKGLLDTCINKNCYPFLLGINEAETLIENKIYFILDGNTSKEKYWTTVCSIFQELNLYNMMKEILKYCDKAGLFLRGFSFNIKEGKPKWRFYCFPSRKLLYFKKF